MVGSKCPADHAAPVVAHQGAGALAQAGDQLLDVRHHVEDEVALDPRWFVRVIEASHVHGNNMVILNRKDALKSALDSLLDKVHSDLVEILNLVSPRVPELRPTVDEEKQRLADIPRLDVVDPHSVHCHVLVLPVPSSRHASDG